MIDTFLTSGNTIYKFLKAFHEKRTLAHLRPVKVMVSKSSLLEKYHEKKKLTFFGQKFQKVENDENRFFCNNFFKIGHKLIL